MPMEVGERDLKTSHVTVYLANRIKGGHLTIFKNISCYSLSLVFTPFFLSYLIFSLILSHFHFFYQVFFTSATLS